MELIRFGKKLNCWSAKNIYSSKDIGISRGKHVIVVYYKEYADFVFSDDWAFYHDLLALIESKKYSAILPFIFKHLKSNHLLKILKEIETINQTIGYNEHVEYMRNILMPRQKN